ncbi:aspartate dehydrogenase [Methanosarcinales archaeon ex4484_138]|nr:MAG: aspartate dehydrogenase [Methanosarcinales archaeon ex4484_138]
MLDVGIVGCGAIGTILARFIAEDARGLRLVSVFDRHIDSSERLTSSLTPQPTIEDVPQMAEHVDIIVECASTSAVPEVARTALSNGCQVMIMSVGALTDPELKDELVELAEKHGTRIHIPSGAIVGIDGLKAAGIVGIDQVVLKTKKNPKNLKDAPYTKKNRINLNSINKETLIFAGTAREATTAFPANINVAATLSLAGIGSEKTSVEIYADPSLTRNVHEILVEGSFGTFTTTVENVPSPKNPRTSYLAALSAIATLKEMTDPLQIGT